MSDDNSQGTTVAVRYLSDDWLAAADRALGQLKPLETDLRVGVVVTDGPDGERRYRLVLGSQRVGVESGDEPCMVRMTLPWTVAVAIATGRASAQRAFLDGHIQFGGDATALLGHQDQLAAIDDRLASLRDITDFG